MSKIWGLVRSLSGKKNSICLPALRIQNDLITDPKVIVNSLAQAVAKSCSSDNYEPAFLATSRNAFVLPRDAFVSDNSEVYNLPFSYVELEEAIQSAGNTSVGPDGLHYHFFRKLPRKSLEFILTTFNSLWSKHVFPGAWKEALVIPLPKPGKDKQNPENYRPISLTSCFGKLLEKMVVKRLNWMIAENNIISKFQSGFRSQHSTMDHLVRLETDIRKGFKKKCYTTAVFLDIKNAYNMVHKPALIAKLYKYGFKGHLAHYIKGFLLDARSFQLRCRSLFSDTKTLQNGLPQGSCLSPILFNLMINDIFDDIPPGISHSLFADDCAIWCTDKDPSHSIPRLQEALNRINEWARQNGFIFSAQKSAAVIFSKNTRPQEVPPLRMAGNIIPFQKSFKFLGVILDSRLSMKEHVNFICLKCKKRLNLFRCLSGTDFGADRRTLLHLYKALVRPVIEYGSIIYASGCKSYVRKLDAIQNSFLRIATGAMKSSPISALLVESYIPPLHIRRIEQTLRYVSKIELKPDHNTFDAVHTLPRIHHDYVGPSEKRSGLTIASRVNKFCNDINFIKPRVSPSPKLIKPPWQLARRHIHMLFDCPKSTLTPEEVQQKFNHLRSKYSRTPFIFTDGSKDHEHTGNAIICGRHFDVARLPDGTSVYLAELHAVFLALKFIENKKLRAAVICSDSRSVLQSLPNSCPTSPLQILVLNLHQKLSDSGVKIQFLWIPGHSGVTGNEEADKMAKRSLSLDFVTELPTEIASIKSAIRRHILKYWQDQWSNDASQTQLTEIKPEIQQWSSSCRQNRQEEKTLMKMRIGHTRLTHSFIFLAEPRPRCTQCDHTLTVKHILLYCQNYRQHRLPLLEYCRRNQIDFTLKSLLGDDHPELLHMLFSFLRNTQLMHKM